MKIALKLIGAERWVAGIYYISNLVKALKSLPENESPEVVLVRDIEFDEKHYRDIEDMVEWYPPSNGASDFQETKKARRVVMKWVLRNPAAFTLARWLLTRVGNHRFNALLRALRKNEVSLLFPCLISMGKDAPMPWLPWAWDLQHKTYPDLFSKQERKRRDHVFKSFASDSPLIVVSSEDVMNDFNRHYPGYEKKMRVLRFRTYPEDRWYDSNPVKTCQRYGLPERFLLLPNQFFAHKNHRVVFEAMKLLVERKLDVQLVCTGNTVDWRHPNYFQQLEEFLQANGLSGRVRILGLIPRDDQIQMMRASAAVIQPSLFEGWSSVVEDARALGKRIYLSDLPVHREQDPAYTEYFDPMSPGDLADLIGKAWPHLEAGPNLRDEGGALVKQRAYVIDYARTFMRVAAELVQNK